MRFPRMTELPAERQTVSAFRGLNRNGRIGEDEFSRMENLTADEFPLLAPRAGRGLYAASESIRAMTARDSLCWVDGSRFVMNGYEIEMGLSDSPKQMVPMGAYVVIFPDKKYINTLNISDFGSLEATAVCGPVQAVPAFADGSIIAPDYIQPEEPQEPANMALWLDNSRQPGELMQWSGGSGMWVPVAEHYIRLEAMGIGKPFRQGDGVNLTGLPEGVGTNAVIHMQGDDFLLIPGLLEQPVELEQVTVRREVPDIDFVIECGNRLWGCRYGLNRQGDAVNEIYASKLGDFRNWYCFAGISTDSYAVSMGDEGPFTGAVQHMGYPVFFRENCLHKIYGSTPASFRLQTTPCRGVQRGSHGSLAMVGELLVYHSPQGICAYDGALPTEVGQALGLEAYRDAAAGGFRGKYYISMADAGGEYHLFVWDRARNLWHREDSSCIRQFCACRQELYMLDDRGRILTVTGTGEQEGRVEWMAQTGDLGLDIPENQRLTKLTLRLRLARDAVMQVMVCYDSSGIWQPMAKLRGRPLGAVTLPMPVRRCSQLRLRLEGAGDMRLYSLTKTISRGSDVF